VVWQPYQAQGYPVLTYLRTSDGVELLAADSKELVKACANSETIYIVDGRAPMHCRAWTLLLTSPEPEHYKRILKESSSFRLYMEPCGQVSSMLNYLHLGKGF
jgi:hypothetical protein